jgi:insertion element IS1 protein InsB
MGASSQTYYCPYFWSQKQENASPVMGLLSGFNVSFWCTDNFSAYDELPNEKHITGTQRIERENLNLRNRLKRQNRKTLGYSKSVEMHDRIIGTFIAREHYVL